MCMGRNRTHTHPDEKSHILHSQVPITLLLIPPLHFHHPLIQTLHTHMYTRTAISQYRNIETAIRIPHNTAPIRCRMNLMRVGMIPLVESLVSCSPPPLLRSARSHNPPEQTHAPFVSTPHTPIPLHTPTHTIEDMWV